MRLISKILSVGLAVTVFSSCHEGLDFDKLQKNFQDSLSTVVPTWNAMKLKPENDGTQLLLVIGDPTFYGTSNDFKTKKADELGLMILRMAGKNNYLASGTLIVTKDPKNQSESPEDGQKFAIDFSALKKQMGQ